MIPRRIFRIPDRRHLWDDTSSSSSNNDDDHDDDDEEKMENTHQTNIEMIDLTRSPEPVIRSTVRTTTVSTLPGDLPPPPTTTLSSSSLIMASYVPHTLQKNSQRYSILPAFPTSFYNDRPTLLLANVPIHKLSAEQLARRQQGVYSLSYTIKKETFDIPSYFRHNYQSFISSLIYQYNIDEAILDYNLYRFSECFRTFADDHIRRHKYSAEQFELNDKQKKYAFEFYLQIDVDLFFMKTCSFRHAIQRSIDEGLFCINEPDKRYSLSPCNNCPLCVPPYDLARRQRTEPPIRFGPNQTFQFCNGYQTILNCPADCQTRNIIYVMTCPCGKFEYIGETSQRLGDRLWYHRQHLNRIIHEFLIGERNAQLSRTQEKDQETLVKDRMLLYRHAARCPSAIQIFLNFNPIYWCFVPLMIYEAAHENRNYVPPRSLVLLNSNNSISFTSKDQQARTATSNTRADEVVQLCMRHIPPMPPGYAFSIRQCVQQFQYFKNKLDVNQKQDETMDLFNVAIIAVLPIDASDAIRRFVEALFITHTETKLNTSGRLLHCQNEDETTIYPVSMEARVIDRDEWCRNLVFPHHQS